MKLLPAAGAALAVVALAGAALPAAAAPDPKALLQNMDTALSQSFLRGKSYRASISKVDKVGAVTTTGSLKLQMVINKKLRADVVMGSTQKGGSNHLLLVDDGTAQWVYKADEKKAAKQPSAVGMMAPFLAKMIGLPMGITKDLKNVKAVMSGTATVAGKPAYVITVTPLKPGSFGPTTYTVTVDQATSRLRKLVTKIGQSVSTLTISDEAVDQPIDAKVFAFTPPPGVKVVASPARPGAAPRK